MSDLGTHRGRPIVGMRMSVQKVGAGLDSPVALDPEDIEVGEERMLCVRVVCVDEHFPPEDRKEPGAGGLYRSYTFDATETFFIDAGLVAEARQAHLERVELAERAREQAKKPKVAPVVDEGQTELEVDEAALERAHVEGSHASGLVDGCPACEWEAEEDAHERNVEREAGG